MQTLLTLVLRRGQLPRNCLLDLPTNSHITTWTGIVAMTGVSCKVPMLLILLTQKRCCWSYLMLS